MSKSIITLGIGAAPVSLTPFITSGLFIHGITIAAYGTITLPNRAGTIIHPNKAGEIKHPNRAGTILSDFQGDS